MCTVPASLVAEKKQTFVAQNGGGGTVRLLLIERLLCVGRGPRETFEGSHGAAPLYLKNSFEWYTDWGPLHAPLFKQNDRLLES